MAKKAERRKQAPAGDDLVIGSAVAEIGIDMIRPSQENPRRGRMEPEDLTELADSLCAAGVLEPILVRPIHDTSPQVYEIVFGERRWRAARQACFETIPAIVREMDDEQAAQARLIENVQRDDLTPMEEARAYDRLIDRGCSQDDVANLVGRNPTHVSRMLSLLRLPPKAIEALESGAISARAAWVLATVSERGINDAVDAALHPVTQEDPLSAQQIEKMVSEQYRFDLRTARWRLADASLEGGACLVCPRMLANVDGWVPGRGRNGSGQICLDPACARRKAEQVWARRAQEAERDGHQVMTVEEASREFCGSRLRAASRYVDLDACPDEMDLVSGRVTTLPWAQLVEGGPMQLKTWLASDESGGEHRLALRGQAITVARANGHEALFGPDNAAAPGGGAEDDCDDDDTGFTPPTAEEHARGWSERMRRSLDAESCAMIAEIVEDVRRAKYGKLCGMYARALLPALEECCEVKALYVLRGWDDALTDAPVAEVAAARGVGLEEMPALVMELLHAGEASFPPSEWLQKRLAEIRGNPAV